MASGTNTLLTTADLQSALAKTPTIEQILVASGHLWQGSTSGLDLTGSGRSFFPGFVAPFPMKLVQVSLIHDSSGDVLGDNTNPYGLIVQRMRAKTGVAVVTRSTTVGNTWPVRTDWNFDVGTFDPTNQLFAKGDALQIVLRATGTPLVTLSDIGYTARFEPQ